MTGLSTINDYSGTYFRLRDECGVLSEFVDELRELILKAAHYDHLTVLQRDELLSLVDQIDQDRQALVGSA